MTADQKIKIDGVVIEMHDRRHKYWNYYKKNIPHRHWDDLWCEVILALYKNPDATCKAIDNKQHVFLATRITLNLWASTTSPYYKKFRLKDNDEIAVNNAANESSEDLKDKQEMEIKNQLIYEALQNLPLSFYEDQLIRMYYIDRVHVTKIAAMHGISTNTVYANIVKVTDKLKQGIHHYLITSTWDDAEYHDIEYPSVNKPRTNNNRKIIWREADGSIRKEFNNIHEAAKATGKTAAYLYAILSPKQLLRQRFKDQSTVEWGDKKKATK